MEGGSAGAGKSYIVAKVLGPRLAAEGVFVSVVDCRALAFRAKDESGLEAGRAYLE